MESSNSIGFVGAAVSSHPGIARLARSVAESGRRAALSSIMSQRVTAELAESLSESEYKTVALAPEAGTENLRFRIGKRVCNEQIFTAIKTLAQNGIRNFKLYLMVGLPAEREEDVEAIPRFVETACEYAQSGARLQDEFLIAPRIILSINPFIPKAWTPFQRHPFLGIKELKRRLDIVQQGVKRLSNVEMHFESPRESYFQALLSRGDRRVGNMLYEVHSQGEDWRWIVKNGAREIVAGTPVPDYYVLRQFAETELLPWEVVDLRVKRSLLEREYLRTFEEDVEPLIKRARAEFEANKAKTFVQPEIKCESIPASVI